MFAHQSLKSVTVLRMREKGLEGKLDLQNIL